jgi:hypothetical protein
MVSIRMEESFSYAAENEQMENQVALWFLKGGPVRTLAGP